MFAILWSSFLSTQHDGKADFLFFYISEPFTIHRSSTCLRNRNTAHLKFRILISYVKWHLFHNNKFYIVQSIWMQVNDVSTNFPRVLAYLWIVTYWNKSESLCEFFESLGNDILFLDDALGHLLNIPLCTSQWLVMTRFSDCSPLL